MKVNGSIPARVSSDNKTSGRRITKAAILTGIVVGGAVLYSRGKNSPMLQKLVNIVTNSVVAPLQQKGVPFSEKITNIGENLKQAVSTLTSKRNGYYDIVDIAQPNRQLLALPEKSSATVDEMLEALLYKDNGRMIFDIPVISEKNTAIGGDKLLALPAPKQLLALPEKTGDFVGNPAVRIPHEKVQPLTPYVINLPGEITEVVADFSAEAGEGVIQAAGAKGGKALAAAGAGAVLTGGAVVAKLNDGDEENPVKALPGDENDTVKAADEAEVKAAEPVEPARPVKHDKVKIVTLDGKEFGGIFENGIAYDEECEPLTGNLVVDFESGKAAVIQYKDGVLQKSLIFKNKEDKTPKEIKTYINGKIHQKFEDISLQDGAFVAKKTSTYRAEDSMLKSVETKRSNSVGMRYFKNSTDKAGKINGKPIATMRTSTSYENGVKKIKFYAVTEENLGGIPVRISNAPLDGTRHIQLIGTDKKPTGTIRLNQDRKIEFYISGSNNDPRDGYISVVDGRVGGVTTDMTFSDKETIAEYHSYELVNTVSHPIRKAEEGEDEKGIPSEITSFYRASDDDELIAVTKYADGKYVKKIEVFGKEGDEKPKSSVIYPKSKKIVAEYSAHKSADADNIRRQLKIYSGAGKYSYSPLEKIECADDKTEAYKRKDGSVIEIEKDEKGYIISIATYIDEDAEYPETMTVFDQGTPVEDIVCDAEGNIIFKSKYSVKPIPKKVEQVLPAAAKREDSIRPECRVAFNDTYNVKRFYESIWTGKYYEEAPVKEITRDENDAYEIALQNPYSEHKSYETMYKILLDQNGTIQRLRIFDTASISEDAAEIFMDEEGHIDIDDVRYAINEGELTKIGPFKKNIERYQTKHGAVIEFAKNEDGTVSSIAYYDSAAKAKPICRTFLENGAPVRDVLYDKDSDEILHSSDYSKDMEDVENPLEDSYYLGEHKIF